jgi:two-component system nitrogen regulation response regulator NtrX
MIPAGSTLHLPPLRDRAEDIPLLVERFWSDLQRKYTRLGPELTKEALVRLAQLPWPGNVRQLRTTVEKLFVLARESRVTAPEVTAAVETGPGAASQALTDAFLSIPDYREARRAFETRYLTSKLQENAGNVTRTAERIGLQRQSLQEKIKELEIRPER